MSYLGFMRAICRGYLAGYREPCVLEIGIDRGQTTFPLVHNLALWEKFKYVGVDIDVKMLVMEQMAQYANISLIGMDQPSGRDVAFYQDNSLNWLPQRAGKDNYDMVLLDGDHNYKTVYQELDLIMPLIHEASIIVVDDYNGQWANKDLYYSTREKHKGNPLATQHEESEKQGVATAVDDWLAANPNWAGGTLGDCDPIILFRTDVWDQFEIKVSGDPGKRVLLSRNLELIARKKNVQTQR